MWDEKELKSKLIGEYKSRLESILKTKIENIKTEKKGSAGIVDIVTNTHTRKKIVIEAQIDDHKTWSCRRHQGQLIDYLRQERPDIVVWVIAHKTDRVINFVEYLDEVIDDSVFFVLEAEIGKISNSRGFDLNKLYWPDGYGDGGDDVKSARRDFWEAVDSMIAEKADWESRATPSDYEASGIH